MLKEGWDVTNLYTIIPLRTAASLTLREQTIGRGLRLPFGNRTGEDKADKLTIVAHDKFQEIIEEANKPDSIIKKENIITIDDGNNIHQNQVVVSTSQLQERMAKEKRQIDKIEDKQERQEAQTKYETKKALFVILPEFGKKVKTINDLKKEEIKDITINKLRPKTI